MADNKVRFKEGDEVTLDPFMGLPAELFEPFRFKVVATRLTPSINPIIEERQFLRLEGMEKEYDSVWFNKAETKTAPDLVSGTFGTGIRQWGFSNRRKTPCL